MQVKIPGDSGKISQIPIQIRKAIDTISCRTPRTVLSMAPH